MPRLGLSFDMRRPDFASASHAELYAAALDMCAWADEHGFASVSLLEHHGTDDGYLPSPLLMTAAIAARTSRLTLLPVLLTPFYDPIRLAEDIAVADLISGGRVVPVLAGGYRPQEFDAFGVALRERGMRIEEAVEVLKRAWTGEEFTFRGRAVRVTPTPARSPRPPILVGGTTKAGARRAARIADGFFQRDPVAWEAYREECLERGKPDPGPPQRSAPWFIHVTEDPERARQEVGPHVVYWLKSYNGWFQEAYGRNFGPEIESVDGLQQHPDEFRFVTPQECIALAADLGPDDPLTFSPLLGGISPDAAWASLELFAAKVAPELA